mgnify:CR=1 FL=1
MKITKSTRLLKSKRDRRLMRLAERIAQDLFTDVTGNRAARLVMERVGETLKGSGLCEAALRDRVFDKLKEATSP